MSTYLPLFHPAGFFEQPFDIHKTIAKTRSDLRNAWASWACTWNFLVHLQDLNFYKDYDEERGFCDAPWAARDVCASEAHTRPVNTSTRAL